MNTDNTSSLQNKDVSPDNPVIAWWSGGITSAVACHLAIKLFGGDNVKIVFIDTRNEDDDTYRFKIDCENWYVKEIETITNEKYKDISEVWFAFKSLNVAHGAICSSELKRAMRIRYQKENAFSFQVFGFDIYEPKRARAMTANYRGSNPIYTLLLYGLSKPDCVEIIKNEGIKIPDAYILGLNNNNCLKTGCVQGGIGYWQLYKILFPERFDKMAWVEHELTRITGTPVTINKDQSKGGGLVFLKPHPDYPNIKDLSMMKGRPPKPLMECNGFCGTNDLEKVSSTYNEINFTNHV